MEKPRLLESIRLEDGQFFNLEYHEARMQRACEALSIEYSSLPIEDFLKQVTHPATGLWKCRVLYSERIETIEFRQYTAKPIRTLKLVYDNDISYTHKYEKRNMLSALYAQRGDCDDIIIVKDGFLTDSYYGNVVLWKEGQWYTPESYLLAGTQRASLLASGSIQVRRISTEDLKSFEKVKVINAMMGLERGPEVLIDDILV